VGLYSLALAAAIGGFIFGTLFAIHTIMQEEWYMGGYILGYFLIYFLHWVGVL
jgi:hypothetical protein